MQNPKLYNLLIVDDENIIRTGMRDCVDWGELGFKVCGTANNGSDAIEKINTLQPDLIITDIVMPDMDGLELCQYIQLRHPNILVIILSGYNEFDYAQKALHYGVFAYLLKPLCVDTMIPLINKAYSQINAVNSKSIITKDKKKRKIELTFLNMLNDSSASSTENREHVLDYISAKQIRSAIVASIRMSSKVSTETKAIAYAAISDKLSKAYRDYVFIYTIQDCLNVFIMDKIKIFEEAIKKFIVSSLDEVMRKLNLEEQDTPWIYIGISNLTDDVLSIKSNLDQSAKALNFTFFKNGQTNVIYYKDIENMPGFSKAIVIFDRFVDNAVSAIRKRNMEILENVVSALLDYFSNINEYIELQFFKYRLFQAHVRIRQELSLQLNEKLIGVESSMYNAVLKCDVISDTKEILLNHLNYLYELVFSDNNSNTIVNNIIDYINNNYDKVITLKLLSEKFFLNPTYISAIFNRHTSSHFSEYVINIRIKKAKDLLRNTHHSMGEIAERTGFKSQSYFTTVFKDKLGVTPLQYRMKPYMEEVENAEK